MHNTIIKSAILKLFIGLLLISTFIYGCTQQPSGETQQGADSLETTPIIKEVEVLPDSLFIVLDSLKTDSVMTHASFSYYIFNISDNSLIASYNPLLSLVPASTMKLLTTAAALEVLGPDARFKTTLSYDGTISNRVLDGNIIITGGGDPTLGSTVFSQNGFISSFIKAIMGLEVDTIRGSVIADPRIFGIDHIPYTWAYGETGEAYAAGASGLTVYDNTYQYVIYSGEKGFKKADSTRMKPRAYKESFYHRFVVCEDPKESIMIMNFPGSSHKIIRGCFPSNLKSYTLKGAIQNPAQLVADELYQNITLSGICIQGLPKTIYEVDSVNGKDRMRGAKKQLTVIYSPTVLSIVQNVNSHSNNLFAEHLLKHLGVRKYGVGESENGVRVVLNFFREKNIDTDGLFMFDGSGLSRFNAITAEQLAKVLIVMHSSSQFKNYYNSLSIAGVTGTMCKLCVGSSAYGQVHAKSGTMSRVKSYAGYARTLKGDTLAFSLIANNFTCPAREMTTRFEKVMIKMVEYKKDSEVKANTENILVKKR